jgi:dTDP-4-amino-4,6-dideoxygalactose transaminase
MKVPYLELQRQLGSLRREISEAIDLFLDSGVYILGEQVRAFESEWAEFCESTGAVGVATGTDALVLALKASGAVREGKGDEVITTPLTAGYTALAIRLAGGVPVFADIDPRRYTIDPQSIEDSITSRTRAIVPVHLYGRMADMPNICSIADRKGLAVIEDAAQAHGARLDGKPPGSFGEAAAFSFYPTKNLGAFGDGGILTARDVAILSNARILRQGGHQEALQGSETGLNSRLDEIQAAILRVKLRYLDSWNQRRRELADEYNTALAGISSIELPDAGDRESHVFHLYVIQHDKRDELRAHLSRQGIETLIHYPFLIDRQPHFATSRLKSLPVAERVQSRILSLPLNPWMTRDEVLFVAEAVRAFEKA